MRICLSVVSVILFASCKPTKPVTLVPSPTPPVLPLPSATPKPIQTGWIKIQTERWEKAVVRPEKVHFAQAIANQITRNRVRYEAVSSETNVPWQVVGAIHSLECDLSFRQNLANGDSLNAKTRHVPKGRIPNVDPPYSWETAAVDALGYDHLRQKRWSDIGNTIQNCELYNGPYYENHDLISPYIHSWDTLYIHGKIIADGRYSSTAISAQCGILPILKFLTP